MYVKWSADLQGRGTKVTVRLHVYFFGTTANTVRGLLGIRGEQEERSPVGLKESYLLLLPITPQSPALSTCKMTLDMALPMLLCR